MAQAVSATKSESEDTTEICESWEPFSCQNQTLRASVEECRTYIAKQEVKYVQITCGL